MVLRKPTGLFERAARLFIQTREHNRPRSCEETILSKLNLEVFIFTFIFSLTQELLRVTSKFVRTFKKIKLSITLAPTSCWNTTNSRNKSLNLTRVNCLPANEQERTAPPVSIVSFPPLLLIRISNSIQSGVLKATYQISPNSFNKFAMMAALKDPMTTSEETRWLDSPNCLRPIMVGRSTSVSNTWSSYKHFKINLVIQSAKCTAPTTHARRQAINPRI